MTPFQARWRQHEADTMPEISPENIHREVDKKCEPLTNIPSEYPGVGVKAEMKGWRRQRAEGVLYIVDALNHT